MGKPTALTLAPGAGTGIGKEVAAALLKREAIAEDMAAALVRALTAKRRTWCSTSKMHIEEDDTRSQLQAVFGILAHLEGDPVRRTIHEHVDGRKIDHMQAVQSSPAMRRAAQHVIDKANAADARQRAAKGLPAELEIDE